MPITQVRGNQVTDSSIGRNDLDAVTPGNAVVKKLIAGANVSLSSTGVDAGTGDVTINVTAGSGTSLGILIATAYGGITLP